MKFLIEGLSKTIGINLWPAPQISEHCPSIMLGRLINKKIWLIRPGMASTLTPRLGIAQEWITSFDDTRARVGAKLGIIRFEEVDISRTGLDWLIVELNLNILTLRYS